LAIYKQLRITQIVTHKTGNRPIYK